VLKQIINLKTASIPVWLPKCFWSWKKTGNRCFVEISYSRPWNIVTFWEVTPIMRYF